MKMKKLAGCSCALLFLIGGLGNAIPKSNVDVFADEVNTIAQEDNEDKKSSIEEWESLSGRAISENSSVLEREELLSEELELNEVDVVSEITDLMADYQAMLSETNVSEEKEKLQYLLTTTQSMFSDYLDYQKSKEEGVVLLNDDIGIGALKLEVLAVFNTWGYKLSAELATVFFDNKDPDYIYFDPIYSYRVISSDLMRNIANGSTASGRGTFDKVGGRNENDLYYSLHNFDYKKFSASSKLIHITDKYDFGTYNEDTKKWEPEEYGLLNSFINILVDFENSGDLIPYEVSMLIDMSQPLGIDIVGETGAIGGAGTWSVDVTNYRDEPIELIYNEKMCFEEDARYWQSLTDIVVSSTKIPAGGTKRVTIQKNAAATHMAFSYIKGSIRCVTFADEIGLNQSISTDYLAMGVYIYDQIQILGKHGTTWMFRVTNTFDYTRTVEYNGKMCFEADAKNWENLNDIKRFTLTAGAYKDISIEENYLADYIALRFLGGQTGLRIYAKDLNAKGTMTKGSSSFIIYTYLTITNAGKSGSAWKINVKNPFDESITVYYNGKMCFDDDAKKWTGLSDIKSVTLSAGQTKQVTVNENFFATAVAFSYVNGGKRLVTYANGLTTSGGIKVMNSVV